MSAATLISPAEILLVENSPADVRLAREALREAGLAARLTVAGDGEAALRLLRTGDRFGVHAQPDLILTDLNLPKMDGMELLAKVKSDPQLRRIPVIVLTTSRVKRDVQRSYNRHANCHLAKPLDLQDFVELLRLIDRFWLTRVELPNR